MSIEFKAGQRWVLRFGWVLVTRVSGQTVFFSEKHNNEYYNGSQGTFEFLEAWLDRYSAKLSVNSNDIWAKLNET